MAQQITEDDLYRASTQFRLWSFTPAALAKLRQSTHDAALKRASTYLSDQKPTVTLSDELVLVQRYSDQLRTVSDHFKWPINVKATAVQYLKRFYLTNSVLTYPPKDIYKSVLFLASKTEGTHVALSEYARRISTDPQQILAPEYKIIQSLRFTLDVRQPYRGLKGTLMELLNMARKEELQKLCPPDGDVTARIHAAYAAARVTLDAPALLTDALLLFTPPQLHLAALRLADPELTAAYLSTKPVSDEIKTVIASCALLLSSDPQATLLSKEARNEIESRLEVVRDPATKDLVRISAALKRGVAADDDQTQESAKKRKRLEREANFEKQGEDLFGPNL